MRRGRSSAFAAFVALVAALLLLPAAASAASQINLLTNGGFESGFTGWGTLPAGSGDTINVAIASGGSYGGPKYLESNTSVDNGSVYQDVSDSLSAGQSATFSMWVRLAPGVTPIGQWVRLCLWGLTSSPTNACQQVTLSNAWQPVSATYTAPKAVSTLRAQLYESAGGNIDFDNGVLTANLLTNGGFESGGKGWSTLPVNSSDKVNEQVYSGNGSYGGPMYFESNTSVDGGSIYQDVSDDLSAGQSATFSMWVRLAPGETADGQSVKLCLWAYGPDVAACQSLKLTTSWQQVSATVTAPSSISTLRAQIYESTGGNIDFDDGVLSANLLTNGGFEQGTGGWTTLPVSGSDRVNFTTYASTDAHDGTRYAESNTNVKNGSIYQDVSVSLATNQSITFAVWARLSPASALDGQWVNLCLWALDAGTNACQRIDLTHEWEPVQATLTAPSSISVVRAQLYESAGGNIDFDGGSLGAPQIAPAVYAPVVTANPSISGTPAVGQTLTCVGGAFANTPTAAAYSWQRDGAPIAGATAQTYTATTTDSGRRLTCALTASNAAGQATATSAAVGPIVTLSSTSGSVPSNSPTGVSQKPVVVTVGGSRRRRHVHVRLVVGFTWRHRVTRFSTFVPVKPPRRLSVTVSCSGPHCRHRPLWRGSRRSLAHLARVITGVRFHAGDKVIVTIAEPGLVPERLVLLMRNGRGPRYRLT